MKRLNKTIAAIAVSIPLLGASALAFGIDERKGDARSEMKEQTAKPSTQEQKSCGETVAEASATFEKASAAMNKYADAFAAHAEWIGQGSASKAERQMLMKTAAAYRDLGKRMKTMATTLEAQREVKDGPHDMSSPKLDRAAQLSMEAAELQAQVADELEQAAQRTQASAQQLQNMRAVGGSGEPTTP